jgi:hypothetical protein
MRLDKDLFKTSSENITAAFNKLGNLIGDDIVHADKLLFDTPEGAMSKKEYNIKLLKLKETLQKHVLTVSTITIMAREGDYIRKNIVDTLGTLIKYIEDKTSNLSQPQIAKEKRLTSIQQFILFEYLGIAKLPKLSGMQVRKKTILLSNLFDKTPATINELITRAKNDRSKIEHRYNRKDIRAVNLVLSQTGLPLIPLSDDSESSEV